MTLIEFHADITRVADALEKLVFLVEKLVFPPPPRDVTVEPATLDDLHSPSEEDVMRMREEKREFAELYQVVPDSPAFRREIIAWIERQRSIHGEQWEAPKDWQSILAQAEGAHRSSRVDSGAPA